MSPYSAGYQRAVVLLLMTAYAFNSMDRSIISIISIINRVNILTVSLIVWSCLTGLCAAAVNFTQLLIIRAGAGVGMEKSLRASLSMEPS